MTYKTSVDFTLVTLKLRTLLSEQKEFNVHSFDKKDD